MTTQALAAYDAARAALEEAARVDEVRAIRDKAVALQCYARQAKDCDLLDHATEIRLRAERKAGAMLATMAESGERARQGGDRAKSQEGILRLADIGVTPKESSRWQALARVEPKDFETLVAQRKSEALKATQASRAERQAEKKAKRTDREVSLAQKQRALPERRYGVIYADPEWRFEVFSTDSGLDRAADNHYPTSTLDEICGRDVASIAADDCVLFMWVTGPMLANGFKVLEAWGFTYKSRFVWGKEKIGNGYWVRDNAEELLIATRGDVPCPSMGDQFEALQMAAKGAHSAKPERFAEIIESYFPNLPKIELNRRGPARPGWDAWGNEAEGGGDE
jgi:N6-adenosine-specific RNA methylase IME4